MKSASAGMIAALEARVSTLATCWRITRRDGVILRFTSAASDLTILGETFLSAIGTYTATQIETSAGMAVDSLDVQAIIDSTVITEADLRAGRYDYAKVEIYQVDYANTAAGFMALRVGTLGEVSEDGRTFSAELRGLMQHLQQSIGRYYTKRCDAQLGDSRCGVNLAALAVSSSVVSVASREVFDGAAIPGRAGGLLTWTGGANAGLSIEIKSVSVNTIGLSLPMGYPIAPGDTYTAYPGCDKRIDTCRDVYANVINFRGFPYIPGPDRALAYPDAK